ncbi:MAG: hypothetical protein IIX40_04570 [Alistipes sp.]|nr:hypothetical protein [Alistipes sp.]
MTSIHRLIILIAALAFVGCTGKTRTTKSQPSDDLATEVDSVSLAKIDVARYSKYGLIEIESISPFVVVANEKFMLENRDGEYGGANALRFDGWDDEKWLNNNYIRSVRLYIDAYNLGLVKDEALDKHKEAMTGKFCICTIEPFAFGGAWMHIAFVEDPSFTLRFWVYSFITEGDPVVIEGYDVRSAELIDEPLGITSDEIKEILKQDPHNTLW